MSRFLKNTGWVLVAEGYGETYAVPQVVSEVFASREKATAEVSAPWRNFSGLEVEVVSVETAMSSGYEM